MQQMKFRFSNLSCSSSQGTRVDPLYHAELSVGLRLRSSDSSAASFSVRSCFAGLLRGNNPVSFFGTVFILQIASLLIPCCRARFPIIELCGHHDFSALSPSLRRQSRKQPAAGSLCYDFCLFFDLHDSRTHPSAMTFACFSNFRLTKNSVHLASRFSLSCLL
ncbi:hypothetical protein GOODEAATRI_028189 [Goodea atripinnis]|uniref:Uncharacterized protein n=1 Tax=Goodea atripinnis TaxID=208336 RepID=A0ABV0Q2G1_9TELE